MHNQTRSLAFALCCMVVGTLVVVAEPNDDLLAAARKGDLAAAKSLVEKGASVEAMTAYGQTPLYLAAMNGHEAVVQFLLEKGASPDVTDTFYKAPMLAFVVMRKHYGVAKLLLAKSTAKPDDALAAIARSGQADLVQIVVDKKPKQEALDKAYEIALDQKETAVAEVLKKAGAKEPPVVAPIDPKVLESYVGTYKTEKFPLDIKVFVKDGKLYMQATGQPEFMPKAKTATVFEFAPAGLSVEFKSASSFMLKQGGMLIPFQKAVTQ
ncbi:MAG: ankyrin repeat domain-containing protein [Acidobacteria bacterium]|nr:ankyrin repeat domain-containing protein [Acidobacteriota bacterium]